MDRSDMALVPLFCESEVAFFFDRKRANLGLQPRRTRQKPQTVPKVAGSPQHHLGGTQRDLGARPVHASARATRGRRW